MQKECNISESKASRVYKVVASTVLESFKTILLYKKKSFKTQKKVKKVEEKIQRKFYVSEFKSLMSMDGCCIYSF